MNIFIICPIYNVSIRNIVSYSKFCYIAEKYSNIQIIIIDNSETNEFKNENKSEALSHPFINYIDNNCNLGLAKAYNIAIEYINSKEIEDYYIFIADDDTDFSNEYLNSIIVECNNKSSHIYSGIIHTSNGVFSPKFKVSLTGKNFISDVGIYNNICCISSGLVFDKYILDNITKYNESFFVDMLDYWLMITLKKKGLNKIKIVDGKIYQNFSGLIDDKKRALKRYSIYKNDCIAFAKCFPLFFPIILFVLIKRRIHIISM